MLEEAFNAAMAGLFGGGFIALLFAVPFYFYQRKRDIKFLLKQEQLGLLSDVSIKKISDLRRVGKFPAATSTASMPSASSVFKPVSNLEAGDLIKKHKGIAIIKQVKGVSVGGKEFSNVIEAERWIAENIDTLSLNDGAVALGRNNSVAGGINSYDRGVDKQGLSRSKDEDYTFVVEALRRYKEGGLSEVALLEIIFNKRG